MSGPNSPAPNPAKNLASSSPGLGKALIYTAKGVFSSDKTTRHSAWLFWISIVGIGAAMAYGWSLLSVDPEDVENSQDSAAQAEVAEESQGEHLNKFFSKTQQEAQTFYTNLEMGKFTIQLTSDPNLKSRAAPGVLHLAEVELTVECESKEICQFIEDHMPKARDSISEVLVAVDQPTLMTPEGKGKLKDIIVNALNRWLKNMEQTEQPHGVRTVFFTKLVIG